MKLHNLLIQLCAVLIINLLTSSAIWAAGVNGHNVTKVDFGRNGQTLGQYVQTNRQNWQEQGKNGSKFKFVERNRDDWSVYLFDASRGVSIQLDLHTKKIYYSDNNSQRRELYTIQNVSSGNAAVPVNGRNVKKVVFGRNGKRFGRYIKTNGSNWQEQGRSGARFNFVEKNRDDWSVYLFDASRGVSIQLDLHTKKVYYSDKKSNKRELYSIMKSTI